jgi:radical SAM protein with 4Fe4S-binding SPASM domain
MNSMREDVQDSLAAVPGTFKRIQEGIGHLKSAGYPHPDHALGIETIICSQNIGELPAMWVWARDQGIVPYFEMITYQGRAKKNLGLNVPPADLHGLFLELARIEHERYGHVWAPHPPFAALSCNRHEYSCTLNSRGYVQPCTGVDVPIGNIRHARLADIVATSPVLEAMRDIRSRLQGACRGCSLGHECYGCRGLAYHVTGDMFAADPLCWKNPKRIA